MTLDPLEQSGIAVEDSHLEWAQDMRCKMISAQVRSSSMQAVGQKAEELVARIQGLFA
jgi:hypothetical protein